MKEIFTNDTSDKELLSKAYKELLKLNKFKLKKNKNKIFPPQKKTSTVGKSKHSSKMR